ncbi:oligosaccharide flippase family protein [Flavobacterium oreochromis]|uniref:oligosaccharide flippase family protein n=1 Tax=Flavobacterium oreochromis TaxID=2906078 RepID=UPI00385C314A
MEEENLNIKSYNKTFVNTLSFGLVQFINVVIALFKGKIMAVFLGPSGIALNNLFNSTLNIISTFSLFGLELSVVREISNNLEYDDKKALEKSTNISILLFLFSAFFGALLTLIFAKQLSLFTFNSFRYYNEFVCLSLCVLFTILGKGIQTIFKSLQMIRDIIISSIYISIFSFLLSSFFFYTNKEQGVIYSILGSAFISFIISFFYLLKNKIKVNFKLDRTVLLYAKKIIQLGFVLIIASLLALVTNQIINVFIEKRGGLKDLGLYSAAISLTTQYVGFLLTALATDFFPRLSMVSKNNDKIKQLVNEQTDVVVLLVSPLLILLIILAPLLVQLFLSKEFIDSVLLIRLISFATFFQLVSYCMGYISFAKSDKIFYLLFEGVYGNLIKLVFYIYFYIYHGINGLGFAYLIHFFQYNILIYLIVKKRYSFEFERSILKNSIVMMFLLTIVVLIFICQKSTYWSYIVSFFIFLFSIKYSFNELKKNKVTTNPILSDLTYRINKFFKKKNFNL